MNISGLVLCGIILLLSCFAHGQERVWDNSEITDKITVKHRIKDTLILQKNRTLMEYEASGIIASSYESCVAVFKDVANFTEIFDYTQKSEQVKQFPDASKLVYFYLDMPWPMADSDAIYRMVITEKDAGHTQIDMISSPDLWPYTKVKRASVGHSVYRIKKVNDQQVHLTATTLSVPVSEAPDWMMQAWFPNGPAKIIRKIEELSNSNALKN